MVRPISGDSTVTQVWSPITLRKPEDGSDVYFETSLRNRPTQFKVPESIYNYYNRESIPEDSVPLWRE
jgi:hypothetical protein